MAVAVSALVATPTASASASVSAAVSAADPSPAPGDSPAIPGHYIVVMDQTADPDDRAEAVRQSEARGGDVSGVYRSALNGFAAELPAQAVEALRRNPHVRYVEPDAVIRAADTQTNAPWGLDRIDQSSPALDGTYRYRHTGAGVTAYIIDSGIRRNHVQFGDRVARGFSAINDGRGTNDCNGHGTHVAGTVGARRYGVAKAVTLRPVRVLNCRGWGRTSGLIAGVDWVTERHKAGAPAVANISIGGAPSPALDAAVRRSVLDGVTYTVAAGNASGDACDYSPARVGSAITVGATGKSDARSSFSNTGICVDLFAPGSGITSTWPTSRTATRSRSGTSMAAPHVAGAAALLLQQRPSATPDVVAQALLDAATEGVVSRPGDAPNRLLYSRGSLPAPAADGNLLSNGGFEQGAKGWSATSRVITDNFQAPARTGSWKAWLNGWGEGHTDTLKQSVTLPSGAGATLSFFLWIVSAEDSADVYDTLAVTAVSGGVSVPLLEFSNADAGSGYVKRSVDLDSFAGQTVQIVFTGIEDDSAKTHFIVDDVAVTTDGS